MTDNSLIGVMIRIGITKEFSLEVAPVMMEQLDQIFGRGIHSSFTDTGVYFSIEPRYFLGRFSKEPYWGTPGALRFYRWVLVVGQHQAVSREFHLRQLFCMTLLGELAVYPYILDDPFSPPNNYVPHAIFGRDGGLEHVCPGCISTEERVLERLRQMDILDLSGIFEK